MNLTEQAAYELRIHLHLSEYRLTFRQLLEIGRRCGIAIRTYTEGATYILEHGFGDFMQYHAFTVFEESGYQIFINERLPDEKRRFVLSHEFGHIFLKHTYAGIMGCSDDPALQNAQEREADEFALCFLGVPCLLKKNGIYDIPQIRALSNLPRREAARLSAYTAQIVKMSDLQRKMCGFCHFDRAYKARKSAARICFILFGAALILVLALQVFFPAAGFRAKLPAGGAGSSPLPAETSVYITSSGEKYHRENCPYLRNRELLQLSCLEAEQLGKTPCKYCFPPQD